MYVASRFITKYVCSPQTESLMCSVSFIGSGNVATHFAKALSTVCKIDTILSKRFPSAKKLATKVGAKATTSFKKINTESDFYILSVPDGMIKELAKELSQVIASEAVVIHTSGATDIAAISDHFTHAAFAWPPQSMSKNKDIEFTKVPICIGASDKKTERKVIALFSKITTSTHRTNEEQKTALHLAAVFANNFSNHMFQLAYEICEEHKLDFKLLYPILLETSNKVIGQEPRLVQTGPAVRDDLITMKKHLSLLSTDKAKKKIYTLLSDSIQKRDL